MLQPNGSQATLGSIVSAWQDQSGNGFNAIAYKGQATKTSNGVYLSGDGNFLTGPIFTSVRNEHYPMTYIAMVNTTAPVTGINTPFGGDPFGSVVGINSNRDSEFGFDLALGASTITPLNYIVGTGCEAVVYADTIDNIPRTSTNSIMGVTLSSRYASNDASNTYSTYIYLNGSLRALSAIHNITDPDDTNTWTTSVNNGVSIGASHSTRTTDWVPNLNASVDAYGNCSYFRGSVKEVLVYDRALTPSEHAQVASYLSSKYPS